MVSARSSMRLHVIKGREARVTSCRLGPAKKCAHPNHPYIARSWVYITVSSPGYNPFYALQPRLPSLVHLSDLCTNMLCPIYPFSLTSFISTSLRFLSFAALSLLPLPSTPSPSPALHIRAMSTVYWLDCIWFYQGV